MDDPKVKQAIPRSASLPSTCAGCKKGTQRALACMQTCKALSSSADSRSMQACWRADRAGFPDRQHEQGRVWRTCALDSASALAAAALAAASAGLAACAAWPLAGPPAFTSSTNFRTAANTACADVRVSGFHRTLQ